MKIYIAHSTGFDFKNELYQPLRESELAKTNEFIFPHETAEFHNSKDLIKHSQLIIAEVSYPSTGMGVELGWANDAGIRIVCIYKKGNRYSQSLKEISNTFIEYATPTELIEKLTLSLAILHI